MGDQLLNLQPWVDDVTTQFDGAMAQLGDVTSVLIAINGEP